MRKIGFIGVYDKTDLLINIAKILRMLGRKVLVIDSTINQKAKYVVPVINPTTTYITEFEEIDVAVGFDNYETIKKYLGLSEEEKVDYDIALIDCDSKEAIVNYKIEEMEKVYFVTSFDLYSLKKGLEILVELKKPLSLTKVLFSSNQYKEEDDYLNFLSLGYKLIWNDYRIYFPVENGDNTIIAENQRIGKIKLKKLSIEYKDSLVYIIEDMLKDTSEREIRNIVRLIEKGTYD